MVKLGKNIYVALVTFVIFFSLGYFWLQQSERVQESANERDVFDRPEGRKARWLGVEEVEEGKKVDWERDVREELCLSVF